jgi:hypothetical protein
MNMQELMKTAATKAKSITTEESNDADLSVVSDAVAPNDALSASPVANNEYNSLLPALEAVNNTETTPQSKTPNTLAGLNVAMEKTDSKIEQAPEFDDFDEIEAISSFVKSTELPTPKPAQQGADFKLAVEEVGPFNRSDKTTVQAVDIESSVTGVETQEYFSGEGVLSNNKKANQVRRKLDKAREVSRDAELSKTSSELTGKESGKTNEADLTGSSEPLEPLAQVLYAASTIITSLPDAISTKWKDWQSREKKFARYNAKSTKAMRNSMDAAASMLLSGDKFKSACRTAHIKHSDITKENYMDILSGLGEKGTEVKKTFSAFSKNVVKHQESLIELDELTTAALASGALGVNSLARQNDTVKKYRETIANSKELIDGIPLFGAKEELDKRKSLSERLQSSRDSLSRYSGEIAALSKGILSKLSELIARLKTYINSKVAEVKEFYDLSKGVNNVAGYLPSPINLATP